MQHSISSKRTSGMTGSEKEKMELVPVSHITISRQFQNGSVSEQACPSSYLVTSSPAKEKQTRKIQKEHLVHLDKTNFSGKTME
jgi:hypothetical protein